LGGTVCLLHSLRVKRKGGIWKNYRGTIVLAPAVLNLMAPHWTILVILRLVNWFGGSWLRWGPLGTDRGWEEFIPNKPMEEWPWRSEEGKKGEAELRESPWSCYPSRLFIGTGYQLLNMMSYLESKLSEIDVPFLCVQGRGDATVPVSSSELLELRSTSKDKTVKYYDRMGHVIISDPLWNVVEKEIFHWVEQRT